MISSLLVRVAGFEPTASWSRTKHATICATPGQHLLHSTILHKLQMVVKQNPQFPPKQLLSRSAAYLAPRYVIL